MFNFSAFSEDRKANRSHLHLLKTEHETENYAGIHPCGVRWVKSSLPCWKTPPHSTRVYHSPTLIPPIPCDPIICIRLPPAAGAAGGAGLNGQYAPPQLREAAMKTSS